MIAWGEELEAQHQKMGLDEPATSTLVKRPATSRSKGQGEANGNERPVKKAKTDGGDASDIRTHFEKGTLNKVNGSF